MNQKRIILMHMSTDYENYLTSAPMQAVTAYFAEALTLLAENGDEPPSPHISLEEALEALFNQALTHHNKAELPLETCEALRTHIQAIATDIGLTIELEITPKGATIRGDLEEEEEEIRELVFEFSALLHQLSLSQIMQLSGTQAGEKLKKMVDIGESLDQTQKQKDKSFAKKLRERNDSDDGKDR